MAGDRSCRPVIEDGRLGQFVEDRYAGWRGKFGRKALNELSLADLSDHALQSGSDRRPPSGRQEYLENLVNRFA